MLPARFLDELSLKTDIIDLIGSYVSLKNKGGSWTGLCPFHREKTPSFHVSRDKQCYYCFGCGAGGGAIQFVMQAENYNYREAVSFLAARAGLTLPPDVRDGRYQQEKRLLALTRDAARWFYSQLLVPDHQAVIDYIKRRGLSPGIVKRFGLGYAPRAWDALIEALTKKGYGKDELLAAGLVVKNDKGGYYDKFRNRLIFPILDTRKRVIAFGGRTLDEDGLPKYLNSPETALFVKSSHLYALHEAKNTKSGRMILTEGYLDTLALYQAGFDCAVASLGTALTDKHAALIARYVKEAVIAYDSDEAGQRAAARAAPMLQNAGLTVKILTLPGAKDPDEFIRARGREAFSARLGGAENHTEHALNKLANQYDCTTDAGRVGFLKEALPFIASLKSAVEREVYIGRAAQRAGVKAETLAGEVTRLAQSSKKRQTAALLRNPGGRTDAPGQRFTRAVAAEEDILHMLIDDPSLWQKLPSDFNETCFSDASLAEIFSLLREKDGEGGLLSLDLKPEAWSRISRVMIKPSPTAGGEPALQRCIADMRESALLRHMDDDHALSNLRLQYGATKGYGGDSQ